MIRSTLLAAASVLALATAAAAGPLGAAGNLTGSFQTIDRDVRGYTANGAGSVYGADHMANGRGINLNAGAGSEVMSGASQGTASEALRNGASFSAAGANNFATTYAVDGSIAGIAGGVGSLGPVDLGAGVAAGATFGATETEVGGTSFAVNRSHGAADGSAEAVQASFGTSTANSNVALFSVDEDLTVRGSSYELNGSFVREELDSTDVRVEGEGTLFGNLPGLFR